MHELLDVRPWPRALLRYPLLVLTALLLGALLAFSYSYAPLHRAKDWKIDYLEERLESRNQEVREFRLNLAEARASLSGTLPVEEIAAIRMQLDEATRLADSREREITSLRKKLAQARNSRDQWRSRHAAALSEIETQQQQAATLVAAEPLFQMAPAAPAPAAPEASGETPGTGTSTED